MAMTADSTSNHVTPGGPGFSGEGLSSPQLRLTNFPSPWSQIVRGESHPSASTAVSDSPSSSSPPPTTLLSDSVDRIRPSKATSPPSPTFPSPVNDAATESSDADNGNATRLKKPAWNKPSNGIVEVGPVMGAVAWPALSESTKPSPKSSSPDSSSLAPLADGSVSSSQVPVIPPLPQKVYNANAHNHALPSVQKSKRGVVSSASVGPTQTRITQSSSPSPPPAFPVLMPPNTFCNLVTALPDHSPRGCHWDPRPVGGFVSQSHHMSDQRNSTRRGNYGQRADGTYHNNFGGRRDQDRRNYSNAKGAHVQPQRGPPRAFTRHAPPNVAAFLPPQPMRPFPNPMGFPEFICISPTPVEAAALRGVAGMPSFIPPAPVLMPVPEPSLAALLVNQIGYYFSDANLVKDEFLKSNMDDQGWVPITLIANFPRVKSLTNSIQLILDSLRTSTVVEVQDNKLRRRDDWVKWIPTRHIPTESGLSSSRGSNVDVLATSYQNLTVEEGDANQRSLMGSADSCSDNASGRRASEVKGTGEPNQS